MPDYNRLRASADLGRHLNAKLETYKTNRRNVESRMMKSYRQYKGLWDEEIQKNFQDGDSQAYPRLTRVKVESFVSRMMHMLFPKTERNWTLRSSNVVDTAVEAMTALLTEYLETNGNQFDQAAFDEFVKRRNDEGIKALEQLLVDQMADAGIERSVPYEDLVRRVVRSAVQYSVGVLRGPLTESYTTGEVMVLDGVPQVVPVERYRPYFEFVSITNYYPDLEAPTFADQDGAFVMDPIAKADLQDLAKAEFYVREAILDILQKHPGGNYEPTQLARDLDSHRGERTNKPGGRFALWTYWGWLDGKHIKTLLTDTEKPLEDDRRYRVFVEVLGDYAIKVSLDPFKRTTSHFHHFVFQDDEASLLGESLPEIMRDSQMAIANGARMLLDNAGSAAGPQAEIDIGLLDLARMGSDLKLRPRKAWAKDSLGVSNGDTRRAVTPVHFDSHIPELLNMINAFKQLSDEETFIGPQTGGDMANMPSEALRTTMNASMILGNSALPFKEIVGNFDKFTISVINALVDWNQVYNKDRVSAADVRPEARGATSLMAKEVLAYSLDNLTQTLTPDEMDYLDAEKLLKRRLETRDLEFEGVLLTEEQATQKRDQRLQREQEAHQMQMRMMQEQVKGMVADQLKAVSQAQKNMDSAKAQVLKALSDIIDRGGDIETLQRFITANRETQHSPAGGPQGSVEPAPGGEGAAAGVVAAGAPSLDVGPQQLG